MKFPVHIWAILPHGKEAESCEAERPYNGQVDVRGIVFRERWREYDGQRRWTSFEAYGIPCAMRWRESFVQRMVWVKTDGWWYGRWAWQTHDDGQREGFDTHDGPLYAMSDAGRDIPQEVMLGMLQECHRVSAAVFSANGLLTLTRSTGRCHCSLLWD